MSVCQILYSHLDTIPRLYRGRAPPYGFSHFLSLFFKFSSSCFLSLLLYYSLSALYPMSPPRELLYQFQFPFIECYSVDSAAQQTQQLAHKSPLISGIVCAVCALPRTSQHETSAASLQLIIIDKSFPTSSSSLIILEL